MKILPTGLFLKPKEKPPFLDCISFMEQAIEIAPGKWKVTGTEVFQYCLKGDIDPRQNYALPCDKTGVCIWSELRSALSPFRDRNRLELVPTEKGVQLSYV